VMDSNPVPTVLWGGGRESACGARQQIGHHGADESAPSRTTRLPRDAIVGHPVGFGHLPLVPLNIRCAASSNGVKRAPVVANAAHTGDRSHETLTFPFLCARARDERVRSITAYLADASPAAAGTASARRRGAGSRTHECAAWTGRSHAWPHWTWSSGRDVAASSTAARTDR
jgi:hypothetical protein